ncbi:MAG: protein kinase [Oscillatoria princeps RMCB-10]|jgi:TM2 domain-containing membrane protein YozV|nr:protein kinase [Oscillatoria princeps RMCB-10]
MSYCLNPHCQKPQNFPQTAETAQQTCQTCGAKLLLGERYRAIKPIDSGGFGRTFLGVDECKPSKPRCVIKQFRLQDSSRQAKAAELFRQEAAQLERLGKHPQIPELLAHFEQEGRQYVVQQHIDGQNLARELDEEGPFNEAQIRQLLSDLLPVLQFVHDHQVIHRDIKPENIIRHRFDGKLVLVDFGAAKSATGTALGATGTVIGSAGYAAPEQALGKAVFASDLYSLGVTCTHLLTQVPPFDLFDTREGTWVWRDYLVNNPVSPQLGQVLDKMLEIPIKRRYQSAAEVLKDLNGEPVTAAPAPSGAPTSLDPTGTGSAFDPNRNRLRDTYLMWAAELVLGTAFRPIKGFHRLYNGKIVTGLLWMIPLVGDVGHLVDLFLIPEMVDEYREKARARMGLSPAGLPLTEPAAITQTVQLPSRGQLILKLLQAARSSGGQLSLTQAMIATGAGFVEVEAVLHEMVKIGYVSVANDRVTGAVTYRFNQL